MASPEVKTMARLYKALGNSDGDAMAALYAPEARFSDPIFTDLRGAEVGAMWRMLCREAKDLRVRLLWAEARGGLGEAHWEADYTFPPTGLPVHQVGKARFAFDGDRITVHTDDWDFGAWARQALGWKGKAFGWTKPFHDQVSARALHGLERFMEKENR